MPWPSLKRKRANDNGTIPTSPRALKRWIKLLPLVDMGETARLFYNGLLKLNRSEMPPEQRVEDMELMREAAQVVLRHLNKQFVARSLPLPPKGRKILRLMLTLHKELSAGYKLAMRDSRNAGIDEKLTALATQRAIYYMGEIFLRSAQMYEPEPAGLWHEIHLLYAFAEGRGVAERLVDGRDASIPAASVAQTYIRIVLCALCLPYTLRQGELERLNAFITKHCDLVSVSIEPTPDARNGVYLANLELDRPPAYMVLSETPAMHSVRAFNLENLLGYLRERTQMSSEDATDRDALSTDLIRRVFKNLTNNSKRRFARNDHNDHNETIHVAIGLTYIIRAIDADPDLPPRGLRLAAPGLEVSSGIFNLQTIEEDLRGSEARNVYYDPNATTEDIWGLVVNDSIWEHDRTERLREKPFARSSADDFAIPPSWSTWQLCNASPGGFGIRWDSDQPARAQVGEIIALREHEGSHSVWRVGVIRWMHFVAERGLEVGVQLLASQCIRASLRTAEGNVDGDSLLDALLLPELGNRNGPSSLIVPYAQLRVGQAVIAHVGETTTRLRLQDRMEYSHSFTQYLCNPGDQTTVAHSETSRDSDSDDFDSLWEKL